MQDTVRNKNTYRVVAHHFRSWLWYCVSGLALLATNLKAVFLPSKKLDQYWMVNFVRISCAEHLTESRAAVPANIRDGDVFHITTEEYLHALISVIEELVAWNVGADQGWR